MKTVIHTTLAALAVAALAGGAHAQTRLAFGASNAQSAHYAYFAALASIVNKAEPDWSASVVETGATVDNLNRMARGQLDIGLVTTSALYHAYNGVKTFDGRPIESKLLWAYNLAPQNVMVRRDSGVTDIAGLAGKRLGAGQRGSSTEATSEEVMALFGIEPDWVRGTNAELANTIKDNRAIGFIKSSVGTRFDALMTDIATFTPIRVLGISPAQRDMLEENLPELSIVDMPGGEMEGTGPFQTWGFMIAVSARPDMDEDTAYRIVKAVMEDLPTQIAAFPEAGSADLIDLTLAYGTSPLHPGAIRYFEEVGRTVPDRLK
jgi:TRAP transporter TAXI family solute receptor